MIIFEVVYRPRVAFARLKDTSILQLALLLLLIRFTFTVINTVAAMYYRGSPMLLRPLFGRDERTYRFYEIFWYGPYGLLMILVITFALAYLAKHVYGQSDVTFRKSFEIVSVAFFTPWLPSVPGDWLLLVTVNAHPAFLVPFHLALLAWECLLVAIGFQAVYGLPRNRSGMLGLVAGALFLGLGALLIR